jgi:hypothetical protein
MQKGKQTMRKAIVSLAAGGLLFAAAAEAAQFRIGKTVNNGMQFEALYIQEVRMTGESHGAHGSHGQMNDSGMPGVHLEAAVHIVEEGHGFPNGSWVPYLGITYEMTRKGSDWKATGPLVPMLANDGPHYGGNVGMPGPGRYTAKLIITPPSDEIFPRHFDKETGVGEWWEPFELEFSFNYIGIGKKGGY